jgi:cytochrome P450
MVGGARRFTGHLRVMQHDRMGFLQRVAREVDRVSRLESIGADSIVVNHPEVLHELLVTRAAAFEKPQILRFALRPLAGDGLFTSNGELWRRQRKLMAPLFQPTALRRYVADMVACAERGLARWRDGAVLELARETTRITMSVAGKTLFGADTFSEADEIGAALTVALDWTGRNAPSGSALVHLLARRALLETTRLLTDEPPVLVHRLAAALEGPLFNPGRDGRQLSRAIARLDTYVNKLTSERRQTLARQRGGGPPPPEDLLTHLIRARDENGARMNDKQVRDEVLTLFVAGHETTATALAWSIYCLCRHPEIYAAVEREVDALDGEPTFDHLPRLALTLRVFKEALRLFPPVHSFGRQTYQSLTIDGHLLRPNTVVVVAPWALHRRTDHWPEPERFDPDRFLPAAEERRPRLAWLPFGAGPRTCIGNHFAMIEGQIVLARLLRHARFELLGDEVPEAGATLRPRSGMPVRVHLRRAAAPRATTS